jgi:ankyrin repeat protein
MQAFFSRLFRTPIISPLATVMLVALLALAWSSPAFCGEIHDAAENGDLKKVNALLKDNPNLVFSKDDYGAMPLHYAAQGGRKDVAELLLANKAEVNAKANNGWTPLLAAAYRGRKDVAELLLANKAEVNSKNNAGWTPLYAAAAQGHKDVAELLRQHGGRE